MFPGDGEVKNVAIQVAKFSSSLNPTTISPVYSETGKCRYGLKCRFLGAHVRAAGDGFSDELSFAFDGERAEHMAISSAESNFVDPDVRKQLRTRKVIALGRVCYLKFEKQRGTEEIRQEVVNRCVAAESHHSSV